MSPEAKHQLATPGPGGYLSCDSPEQDGHPHSTEKHAEAWRGEAWPWPEMTQSSQSDNLSASMRGSQ